MGSRDSYLADLIEQAARNDKSAVERLMREYRGQFLRMVALRMDRRLAKRVDPSDIVQDALAEACRNLSQYLQQRPIPFYPWLRRFVWQRLVQVHRQHLDAQKRSVRREVPYPLTLPDESAVELADCLAASGTSPNGRAMHKEMTAHMRSALDRLSEHDRELLTLWYLEQLSAKEIAAVLEINVAAVNMRHLRALRRLKNTLDRLGEGFESG